MCLGGLHKGSPLWQASLTLSGLFLPISEALGGMGDNQERPHVADCKCNCPYLSHASLWTSVPTTQKGSTGADSLCTPPTCAQLRFLLTLFILYSSVPASSTVHPWLLLMLPASFCPFSQWLPSLRSPSWLSGITLHRCSKWLLCWLRSLAKHPHDYPLGKSTCMAEVGKLKLHFPCSFAQIKALKLWKSRLAYVSIEKRTHQSMISGEDCLLQRWNVWFAWHSYDRGSWWSLPNKINEEHECSIKAVTTEQSWVFKAPHIRLFCLNFYCLRWQHWSAMTLVIHPLPIPS